MRRIVVVGASLAGLRAAQALRERGFDGELTVVGAEDRLPYDRPPLSKELLTGATGEAEIALGGVEELRATWRLGVAATSLDLAKRSVSLADGSVLTFDGLVVATGASPWSPPGITTDREGVHVLRTLSDALALRADLDRTPSRVVVLGAGFIGGELASTCRKRGLAVTLVDPAARPLSGALGGKVATAVGELHADHGVDLRLGLGVERLLGGRRVEGVVLTDGTVVTADVVVVATGVRPATGWLRDSGLELDNGVCCSPTLASTVAPFVVAAGDVARWTHPHFGESVRVEHWTNAVDSGSAAAETLLRGADAPAYDALPSFWSDQFGIRLQGVGLPALADECAVVEGSLAERRFVAVYGRNGRTIGAVSAAMPPRRLMAHRRAILARAPFPAGEVLGMSAS